MEEVLTEIGLMIFIAVAALFGHVALWSVFASVASGITTMLTFVVVFVVALPFARSQRFGTWPRRIAKTVLVVEAFLASLVAAIVTAVISESHLSLDPLFVLIPAWISGFVGLVWWIVRLGRRHKPNRGVPADRDPRERGPRPLNTDR